MQLLAQNPEIQSYQNEEGNFIKGFLIGTKMNDANWKINKKTGHDLIRKFEGTDFAIIPELLNTPLSKGGGGHYFGQDTREDLLKGYADNSHGKYHKILGPYSYNDGTDDYWYSAIIKLRDSKAASELVKHGAQTWVPYSISPHIWPLAGLDEDIYNWEPIGGALVIKGAYGPQAIISKLCKGTSAACEKSLGASYDSIGKVLNEVAKPCEQKDQQLAQTISSLVSKSASIQTSTMTEDNKASAPAPTPTQTPQITMLGSDSNANKSNPTVNAQEAITTAQITNVVTPEQFAESQKRNAELEKQVKQLLEDKKINTLNSLLAKSKDEKANEELKKKYLKFDNIDQIKEIINDWYPVLKASDEEEKPAEEDNGGEKESAAKKAKGKSASLPREPELPKEDISAESKAASIPVNKLKEIIQFHRSGGRA